MAEKLEDLVVAAQTGDQEAYNEIVHRFQDMAIAYAYAIVGDYELAEDARQEAFLGAYCDLLTLREPAAFPGWFRAIVRHRSLQVIRGRKRLLLPLEEVREPAAALASADSTLAETEERERLQAAIGGLPEGEREVVRLFYLDERSLKETGGILRLPVKTVKSRLHSARARLRQRLMNIVKKDVTEQTRHGDRRPLRDAATQAIEQVSEELQGVLRTLGEEDRRHATELLCTKGRLLRFVGRMDEARATFEDGLELPELRRSPSLRTLLHAELGLTWVHLSDFARGREELAAALIAARRQQANPRTIASILNGLGLCAWGCGELERAQAFYRQVAEFGQGAPCAELAATAENNLALLDWKRGKLEPALARFRSALAAWKKLRNRYYAALTLMNIGIIEENLGRTALARRHYAQALALATEIGFGQVRAAAEANLSNLELGEDHWQEAREAGSRAAELSRGIGDRRGEAIALENQALAALGLRKQADALRLVQEARRLARAIGDAERILSLELVEIEVIVNGGKDRKDRKDGDPVKKLLERIEAARIEAERLELAAEMPRVLRLLGAVRAAAGDLIGASLALEKALAGATQQGNRPEARRIAKAQRACARLAQD